MSKSNYWITKAATGWKDKREEAGRAAGIFDTQREAENHARQIMKNLGNGGELITQDKHGKIRSKDTINAYDPSSVRDTEH